MASGLVFVGMIVEVRPIDGADRIEAVTAVCGSGGRWSGVAKKGEIPVGESCMVFVQDSLLPSDNPDFAFMERYKYIVRMRRFKGVPSEALIMPMPSALRQLDIGTDITDDQRVTKYEKESPYTVSGNMLGNFPSFIPKTDEPNFQKVPHLVEALKPLPFYITEKEDGSSCTVFWREGKLHICSRNRELYFDERNKGNAIYEIAIKYQLECLLEGTDMAMQFEAIGPRIQGNPLQLKTVEPRLFQIYSIDNSKYLSYRELKSIAEQFKFPMVPLVAMGSPFGEYFQSDDDIRNIAEGFYPNGKQREGVVIRPIEDAYVGCERISFKSINLLYDN